LAEVVVVGFSVSGAAAIVFTGLFVAFSMWYGASYNSFERISDAQHDRSERVLETQNIAIDVVAAEYSAGTLTVEVNNTGAEAVGLNDTDVLVDNAYQTDWRAGATVATNGDTWLWQSGERLHVEFDLSEAPSNVRVVTDQGVADATEVTVL
jgi:flagellar protein FlaF